MPEYYLLNTQMIERCMDQRELKKYWVAEEAGVHKTTLRRWLSGRISKVKGERIARLSLALGVPCSQIARLSSNNAP